MRVAARSVALLALWFLVVGQAEAGHEFPFSSSFYPQEIQIEAVDPASAATRLQQGSLHAYIGNDPFAGKAIPAKASRVEFLGSYVVVTQSAST